MEQSYKEKYEQAIERLKQWDIEHQCTGFVLSDRDKFIFPELAESEDEKVRQKILFLFYAWRNNEQVNIPNKKEVEKTIAWLKKQGKPSDEEMKTLLRTEYEKGRADAIAEIQKEWSEEDEKIINSLIDSLTRISLNTRTDSTSPNYTFYKEIDWLKSLRPQNRWKPSDEQMELLSEVQNALLGKDCHNRFTNFIWELKKLKEE